MQLVTLATHHRLLTIYSFRENVEIGGLMSYGSSAAERDRQVGIYTGRILKGEKAAELPLIRAAIRVCHQPANRKSPSRLRKNRTRFSFRF